MFGIFSGIQSSVENAFDVGIGALTLGEEGDFSKKSVSKLVSDGIEVAIVSAGVDEVSSLFDSILGD